MCFWQYWDFCSLCRCGCCSQNLFTSIRFIQLFIIPLWSPSLSLSLSPLILSFPCFLCLSVSMHSVFLLSQRHIFRPLLLWWRTPWRSQWWGWPFHIKWVVNRICCTWSEYKFWQDKTNTGKYKFDNVECLLCMGKTGESPQWARHFTETGFLNAFADEGLLKTGQAPLKTQQLSRIVSERH